MTVVIIGAGGQGRELAAVIRARARGTHEEEAILGFLDDGADLQGKRVADSDVLGRVDHLSDWPESIRLVLGLGYPSAKLRALERLDVNRYDWPPLLHPTASIGDRIVIGRGVVVQAGVVLTTDISIDEFVTINVGVTVNHDCHVKRLATLSPGVHVGGNVEIGEGAFVGIGASVIQGVRIGAWSVVGAGAAVIRDVEPNTIVAGVPARKLRAREDGWQRN